MEVDQHEIASSEAALAKNVDGDVREYAETLRDDHTRNLEATRRLMGGAGGMGTTGTGAMDNGTAGTTAGTAGTGDMAGHDMAGHDMAADPQLAAQKQKHDAERERLAAMEGDEFERAWVEAMVKGHEEALAKLDNELIPNASDAGVRQHLQSTREAISRHLETARGLSPAR
jgi:putative membrane protein